jgi:16S rRNA (guanine966-N2)-methyltransferase
VGLGLFIDRQRAFPDQLGNVVDDGVHQFEAGIVQHILCFQVNQRQSIVWAREQRQELFINRHAQHLAICEKNCNTVFVRIVAGIARGRTLNTPLKADVIRPTSDRVRESIFNMLGQWCEGLAVLDVFAGTGALGFEAMSRGATKVVMIDSGREAKELCQQNAAMLKMTIDFIQMPAESGMQLMSQRGQKFDLIFADPPYQMKFGTTCASLAASLNLLNPNGRLVFEGSKEESIDLVESLAVTHERVFGDTKVSIFELT